MIYYKEEKKKLVIPSGFVMIPIECDEAIEQAREQGYQEGFADGSSATCDTEEGTYSLTDDFDGEETVFPSEGKTGFNKIVIVDDGYGDKKYDEGYEAGLADCSGSTPCDCSSAVTEAYQSGYTEGYTQGQADCPECSGGTGCNLENGRVELGREWDGNDTIYPSQGYDGFGSIQITDNGYGNEKYQSGYTEGYNDGQGGGCNLQEKSVNQNTNLVTYNPDAGYDGLRTISVDATGVYSNGHNDGQNYARSLMVSSAFTENGTYTRAEGWNSVTVNVQQSDCSSAITEAYQSGYTEGYTQGQADCPQCSGGTCNLTETWIDLMDGDDFEGQGVDYYVSAITPNYDGWYKVHIQDKDYGQSKYTEGYNAAITANCGSAITEAYESGVTVGYIDSSTKLAYFDQPAWVDTHNNTLFEEGDTLDMVFSFSGTHLQPVSNVTVHLFNNGSSSNTLNKSVFSIDFEAEQLFIYMYSSDGNGWKWAPFSSYGSTFKRYTGDTYHLIVRSYNNSFNEPSTQAILVNESRFTTYTGSTYNNSIHFSSGTTDSFRINCLYDEQNDTYSEMCSGLIIKSLKIYKQNGETIGNYHKTSLTTNMMWKDGKLLDTVTGEYNAYVYENGSAIVYSLPSIDDTLNVLW